MNISRMDSRDAFFDELLAIARKDKDVIFITADMGAFSLEQFKKELPRQYINVGVAEQNMISVAAGLAMAGKKVYVYSIVPFTTLRCYEQIKVDICCMNLPVTIVGIGAGVMYGGDGPTHHALHDIAVMRALPEMTIMNPSDAIITQIIARQSYEHQGPMYVRIEKGKLPLIYDDRDPDFSKGMILVKDGHDGMIVASGLMVHVAMQAAEELEKQSIHVAVADLYQVKPLNDLVTKQLLCNRKEMKIITLEENALTGGIGSALAEWSVDQGIGLSLMRLAFPDVHCYEACAREQLHEIYDLSAEKIAERIRQWLQG